LIKQILWANGSRKAETFKRKGGGKVMYKVLKRNNGRLLSPFQNYEYEPGKGYVCPNFDEDKTEDCSHGYYATEIDGLIYSFRNLPGYEVWEVEVGGKRVEIDQFKRRYERIRLIRQVPYAEIKKLAQAEEERVGYRLTEALFPVNPLKIERTGPVTKDEIELLKQWASVRDSVWDSGRDSVWDSVRASVGALVGASVWASVRDSVMASVWDSVWDSAWAYVSSLFPNVTKWEHIDHPEGVNPFQHGVDLWHRGLVPSYDGEVWRLHAGEKAEVVWQGSFERTGGGE
jgi:hypothetical protein